MISRWTLTMLVMGGYQYVRLRPCVCGTDAADVSEELSGITHTIPEPLSATKLLVAYHS